MITPLIISILTICTGLFFREKQKRAKLGGEMALSKSLWLSFAILSWFILPLYFFSIELSFNFRIVLIAISVSMWTRGIIELVMLYFFKNWKPLYGIIHNIFTLILGLFIYYQNSALQKNETVYIISIFVSLLFETYFAYFFHKHIGIKTEGDEAVWFANAEDPLYKTNLRVTTLANTTLYMALVFFLFTLDK